MRAFGKIGLCLAGVVCISAGWLLFAQSLPNKNRNKSTSATNSTPDRFDHPDNYEIDNLTSLARNAPPEVAADVLLTLASSSGVKDSARSIAFINEAFQFASQAREPFKQKSWGLQVDSRSGFKEAASNLQLDRISLQSRAVIKMIPLDRVRARDMFEEISLPPIATLTCKDALVHDLNLYYQAMQSVAETCFTAKEKKASLPIHFLAERIERIESVSQVTPAQKVIVSAKTTREELFILAQVMTKALSRINTDPRSFAFAIERDLFVSTTDQLISKLKQNKVPVTDLISASRAFLIKNLSGEVCEDARWVKDSVVSIPRAVENINSVFAQPITLEEIRPLRIGPRADNVIYWTTPKAREVMEKAKALRFGDSNSPLSLEQRETPEWHQKLLDFLELIGNWESASESSEDDYFQERCNMYNLLVELCPDDSQRDAVLRRYASYLKETSGQYKGRREWVLAVKDYLRALQSKSETIKKSSLDPWLSSSDASLRVYGKLAMFQMSQN